jgi:hypothetical protein
VSEPKASTRQPIQWAGVLFAIASNLLLVTIVDLMLSDGVLAARLTLALRLLAPIVAGILTALYARQRGGIHALIGGVITIPLFALLIFIGNWPFAALVGLLCAFGGAIGEVMLRQRRRSRTDSF